MNESQSSTPLFDARIMNILELLTVLAIPAGAFIAPEPGAGVEPEVTLIIRILS